MSFLISFLMYFYFLLKMRDVFRFMLIAYPALRIEKVVGSGCRAFTPWELLAVRDKSLWLPRKKSGPRSLPSPPGQPQAVATSRIMRSRGRGSCLTQVSGAYVTLVKSFLLLSTLASKPEIGMQVCPVALSPPGLITWSISLVVCQPDSQGTF